MNLERLSDDCQNGHSDGFRPKVSYKSVLGTTSYQKAERNRVGDDLYRNERTKGIGINHTKIFVRIQIRVYFATKYVHTKLDRKCSGLQSGRFQKACQLSQLKVLKV